MMMNDPVIVIGSNVYTDLATYPKNWNNTNLAQTICKFNNILINILVAIARSDNSLPASIQLFSKHMVNVLQAAEMLRHVPDVDPRRVGIQKRFWTDLENQYLRGLDQYPKDLTATYNVLLNHTRQPNKNNGKRMIQNGIDLSVLNDKLFDLNNYNNTSCHHRCVLPIGINILDMQSHNEVVQRNHMEQIVVWNSELSYRRGAKPKPGNIVVQ